MGKYAWLVAFFLVSLLLGAVGSARAPQAESPVAKLALQQRDAARKTYEVMWTNYREGRLPGEVLYRWSRRWLKAEQQLSEKQEDRIAAFNGHCERMMELEKLIAKLQSSGQVTIDEASAAAYYRAEAQIWLEQAKETARKTAPRQ